MDMQADDFLVLEPLVADPSVAGGGGLLSRAPLEDYNLRVEIDDPSDETEVLSLADLEAQIGVSFAERVPAVEKPPAVENPRPGVLAHASCLRLERMKERMKKMEEEKKNEKKKKAEASKKMSLKKVVYKKTKKDTRVWCPTFQITAGQGWKYDHEMAD